MLRRRFEGASSLPPEREENAARRLAERFSGIFHRVDLGPDVAAALQSMAAGGGQAAGPRRTRAASTALAEMAAAYGCVASISTSMRSARRYAASPRRRRNRRDAPEPAARRGSAVRPASDSVTARSSRSASAPASSRASAVPPRMRMRPMRAEPCHAGTCLNEALAVHRRHRRGRRRRPERDRPRRWCPAPISCSAAERHLKLAAPLIKGRASAWPSPFAGGIDEVLEARGSQVCVLASGDPFHYGVGSVLAAPRRRRKRRWWCRRRRPSAWRRRGSAGRCRRRRSSRCMAANSRPHPPAPPSRRPHPRAHLGQRRAGGARAPAHRDRLRHLAHDRARSAWRRQRAGAVGDGRRASISLAIAALNTVAIEVEASANARVIPFSAGL